MGSASTGHDNINFWKHHNSWQATCHLPWLPHQPLPWLPSRNLCGHSQPSLGHALRASSSGNPLKSPRLHQRELIRALAKKKKLGTKTSTSEPACQCLSLPLWSLSSKAPIQISLYSCFHSWKFKTQTCFNSHICTWLLLSEYAYILHRKLYMLA